MTGSCPVSAHVCQETARERDELRAEVERLRAGIERLTCPVCVRERGLGRLFRRPDCGRCWEDSLYELLNPTEGEN